MQRHSFAHKVHVESMLEYDRQHHWMLMNADTSRCSNPTNGIVFVSFGMRQERINAEVRRTSKVAHTGQQIIPAA